MHTVLVAVTMEAFIVVAVLAGVLMMLVFTRIAADAILLAGLAALMAVPYPKAGSWHIGVISPEEGLSGFANTALATIAALYILVSGLRETGTVSWISGLLFRRPRTERGAITNLFIPTCAMSAFLNNTAIVAMLIPAVTEWSRKLGVAPSKLMIPLSYASILGGTCCLIGTSTNLVVAGLVISQTDLPSPGMFDIAWVGVPVAIAGGLFLIIVGPRLLPDRSGPTTALSDPREYILDMLIPEGSGLDGKTVESARLRQLPGCYLFEIERGGEVISSISPESLLRAGDRLRFVGVVEAIRDVQRLRGLVLATDQIYKLDARRYRRRLFEVVVSKACPIIGKSIRQGKFRSRYDGVVIGVARQGERVTGRVGDIKLRAGDVLLVEGEQGFADKHRNSRDFLLVSGLDDSAPQSHSRAPIAIAILFSVIALATFEVMPMVVASLVGAGMMVLTRCCSISQARSGVDWSVLIVVGAALGIGNALLISGVSSAVADTLISLAGDHPWLLLVAVYAATSLLTEVVTNNAAVAMIFPLTYMTVQQQDDLSFAPFMFAIMMAGSASFATPLGYQTNLMVYGPGSYTTADFLRIGIPMNVLTGIVSILMILLFFPF
ncbi:MAG: SLC13 family permease [Phycisphaerales bacterium]